MAYMHYFDVRVAKSFDSDIEDFEEAFEAWVRSFQGDSHAFRKALLSSDESTKNILQNIIHSDTFEIES